MPLNWNELAAALTGRTERGLRPSNRPDHPGRAALIEKAEKALALEGVHKYEWNFKINDIIMVMGNVHPYLPAISEFTKKPILLPPDNDYNIGAHLQKYRPRIVLLFEVDFPYEYLALMPARKVIVNATPHPLVDTVTCRSRRVASYLSLLVAQQDYPEPIQVELTLE